MSVMENFKMALSSLQSHKIRSILTMLGIIIGVGAVITIVAVGQGGEAELKSQLVGGENTMELIYLPPEENMQNNASESLTAAFTSEDIRVLESMPEIAEVAATSSEFNSIRHREEAVEASITGINQAYLDVKELQIEKGRNLMPGDFLAGRRTAVVSHAFQEKLFNGMTPVGKIVYVHGQPVEIVGVLQTTTGMLGSDSNEVFLPQSTWKTIFGKSEISQVTIQMDKVENMQRAAAKAVNQLNQLHGTEDAYQAVNMEEIAAGLGQVTRIMTIIISSVAGVSLLVGGIGVMNIMLVSVTERTREIGIRMSLGATRGQILLQFLIESVTLTLIGGTIGIVLGSGLTAIISAFAGWPMLISWPVIVLGLLFSMIIGVIFGILPAHKASNLNPIESLRYE